MAGRCLASRVGFGPISRSTPCCTVAALLLAALVALAPAPSGARVPKGGAERILRDLKSKKARVRVRAAHAAGRHRVEGTAEGVREALEDPNATVRATACMALARLKDQSARPGIVKLLGSRHRRLRQTAEKALIALDKAAGRPRVFVALGAPGVPDGTPPELGPRLNEHLTTLIASTEGVLLSAGEEKVLKGRALKRHFARRKLMALRLSPAVHELRSEVQGDRLVVHAKVGLVAATLLEQAVRFMTDASAHVGDPLSVRSPEREASLQTDVLQAATRSALDEVLDEAKRVAVMSKRRRRRRRR